MKRPAAIATAVLTMVLAASSAAWASAAACRSGAEVIAASTTDLAVILAKVPVLPAKASGVVSTEGTAALGGPANGTSSLDFRAGKLTVRHTKTSGGTRA